MGISASQARLLSITARLTSNEYETQQLSNAKMRLAMKSQEANKEYIAALSATSLQYVSYDAHGSQITQDLTANILYNYSGFKNQYMISNAAGQAMVLSLDAKNFRKSKNLDEFLGCYGVEKVYKTDSLAKNAQLLASEEIKDYYTAWADAIENAKNANYAQYDISLTENEYYTDYYVGGDGANYCNNNYGDESIPFSGVTISDLPPLDSREAYEQEKRYFQKLYVDKSNSYYNSVLAHNADSTGSAQTYQTMVNDLQEFKFAQECHSHCSSYDNWLKWKAATNSISPVDSNTFLNDVNEQAKKDIQKIIDNVMAKIPADKMYDANNTLREAVKLTVNGTWGMFPETENTDEKNIYAKEIIDGIKDYFDNPKLYYELIISQAQQTPVYTNVQKYYDVLNEFLAEAEELGCSTLEDTYQYNDPEKAQWYTNLWYQMNGESSYKSAIGDNETNFVALDSQLANSAEWVKNAISQGLITISVSSNTKAFNDLNTNITYNPLIQDIDVDDLMSNPLNITLKGISWKAIEYTSAGDFVEKDDTRAVAKAQAEYERITNEIAIKDKKYESKIKTLDTEHNALQQQYSSVKAAMDKNIDRSYKTFNG